MDHAPSRRSFLHASAGTASCLDSEAALTVVSAILIPEDFYRPDHKLIFSAILELVSLRSPVDIITVSDLLSKKGELDTAGGTAYISQLSDLAIIRSNAAEYAGIVRQKSMLRKLISSLDEVMKLSFEGEQEANNLVDIAIERLSGMHVYSVGQSNSALSNLLPGAFAASLFVLGWIAVSAEAVLMNRKGSGDGVCLDASRWYRTGTILLPYAAVLVFQLAARQAGLRILHTVFLLAVLYAGFWLRRIIRRTSGTEWMAAAAFSVFYTMIVFG